jgi:hypothetical protein
VDPGPRLALTASEAEEILFADEPATAAPRESACPASALPRERIRCLLGLRYARDAKAEALARELFDKHGIVAGVEKEHTMNGGYRGMLHLVPELPVDAERKHLEWMAAAYRDFEAFFAALAPQGTPLSYRWRPITLKWFRSVKARTPSAYAIDWTIAYNLSGSLHLSGPAVRETMFHETFHLNDQAHGDWSDRALAPIFDGIVRRCGANMGCLGPYSPGTTVVKGGTYYSFQPGNGVREYAAELAVRYWKDQRVAMGQEPGPARPFKCGPKENADAWRLFVAEFFAGIDKTGPCK